MTSIRFLEFLLFLLLPQVYSEEVELVFKAADHLIEMGYCFGVDYIVVYRSAPEGDQLLGNSSADIAPPEDLQGRIRISKRQQLLGLEISHLTHMDSGLYRRECWQNQTLVSQHTQKLSVCDEEVEVEEIVVKEEKGWAELLCNSTSVGLEGTSVRWYREMYPSYKITLILDSSVSLEPLVEELQGGMEVRDGGTFLLLNNSILKINQHFYCLVIKGKRCLSFQTMSPPDDKGRRDIFASQGDRVVLNCPLDGDDQRWETPLGIINGSSVKNNQMYISFGNKSEEFSLVITAFSYEHSGEYSCTSSSFEFLYMLNHCPKKVSHEKVVFEGGSILLDCDVNKGNSQSVLWYRQEPSGQYKVIHDSLDQTVPIPQDLRGRLTPSEKGSSLTLSHLEVKDLGVYCCVVLEGPELVERSYDDYYGEDYAEEYTEEDDNTDNQYWYEVHQCVSKQETILRLEPETGNLETDTTADPPSASDVTAYAVGGGVACLLVLGAVVAVIAVRKRAEQRKAAGRSGLNTTRDIKMTVDPDCTKSLTHNDGYGA